MSRLFHALVVTGAALSAAACAGKSTRSERGDDGEGGSSGSASGSSGTGTTTGGAGPAGGGSTTTGGSVNTGGSIATGGSPSTGGVPTGGSGTVGGTAGVAGLPEPGPYAQWSCAGVVTDDICVDVLGTTATVIPKECPIDPTRPRTEADCAAGELFSCALAMTQSGELVLVNCYCESMGSCGTCWNLSSLYGYPAYCDGVRKVCACAYTGILR